MADDVECAVPGLIALLDSTLGDGEKLRGFKEFARTVPPGQHMILLAAAAQMKEQFIKEGMETGFRMASSNPTFQVIMKNNSDNQGNTIATGSGAAASSNAGQQQGVSVGSGTARVEHSTLAVGAQGRDDDAFDPLAFEKELTDALHMMVDRIEAIEAGEYAAASEALAALRRMKLDDAKKLSDVQTMIEDLWDEKMRKKYSPLRSLMDPDGLLADAMKLAPTLAALLKEILPVAAA